MKNPRVASRYAKALISLSVERNELDAVKGDVDVILDALKESRELRAFLSSPVIKPLKKQEIVKAVFDGKLGELAVKFLDLLVEHHREHFALEILESFIKQYFEAKNMVIASITTAFKLDDKLRADLVKMIEESTKEKVVLQEHINEELIGGFVVRIGDNELDSSIAGRLNRLRGEFEENPYVSAL